MGFRIQLRMWVCFLGPDLWLAIEGEDLKEISTLRDQERGSLQGKKGKKELPRRREVRE